MIEYTKEGVKHLPYVEEIYKEIPVAVKERLVKLIIFQGIELSDKKYKISKLFQEYSNRVDILDDIHEVVSVLMTTELFLTKEVANWLNVKVKYPEIPGKFI